MDQIDGGVAQNPSSRPCPRRLYSAPRAASRCAGGARPRRRLHRRPCRCAWNQRRVRRKSCGWRIGAGLHTPRDRERSISATEVVCPCRLRLYGLVVERFAGINCQSARKRAPGSACNKDPFVSAAKGCPGSEQGGPARAAKCPHERQSGARGRCLFAHLGNPMDGGPGQGANRGRSLWAVRSPGVRRDRVRRRPARLERWRCPEGCRAKPRARCDIRPGWR